MSFPLSKINQRVIIQIDNEQSQEQKTTMNFKNQQTPVNLKIVGLTMSIKNELKSNYL